MKKNIKRLVSYTLLSLTLLTLPTVFLSGSDPWIGVSYSASAEERTNPTYGYKVVNTFPHDTEAFTQGLYIEDGILYESTGLKGKSTIKKVDLKTGEVIKSRKMQDKFFGEGLTIIGDKIYQITWQSKTGFVYDKESLEILRTFSYKNQGWGITYDGKYLVISDGSDTLYFMHPTKFVVVGTLEVYDDDGKVSKLNELEYIDGKIYANIWGEDLIAIIDPKTGNVNSWIDLSGLLDEKDKKGKEDVLNGIAYDPDTKRLFVTGKFWPKIYEIEIVPNK